MHNMKMFSPSGVYCNGRVRCPWHGACFNIKTGDIEDFPGLDSLHAFKVLSNPCSFSIEIYVYELMCRPRSGCYEQFWVGQQEKLKMFGTLHLAYRYLCSCPPPKAGGYWFLHVCPSVCQELLLDNSWMEFHESLHIYHYNVLMHIKFLQEMVSTSLRAFYQTLCRILCI